jgi:rhomboid protease GluP
MTAKTFGRRGIGPGLQTAFHGTDTAAAATAPDRMLDRGAGAFALEERLGERSLLADIPFLTVCMIAFLMFVFGVEKRLAFDVSRNGDLSIGSLIAFGAVSYHLVIGSGEWWRVGLAPLLHASFSHLLGNSFALFFVGVRLEPMIGRAWFSLIFVASALGGVAGSLIGNPPDLSSVGASGAITGLIGALFVVSFHHRAEPAEQWVMRRTALGFGIPALLPLALGASGKVDYFAHAGGAIAGAAVALAVCAQWSADSLRPSSVRPVAIAALIGLAGSIVSCGIAATHYASYAATAEQLIPASQMPTEMLKVGPERSAELLRRYPGDPRSHLMRAFFFAQAQRPSEAEAEFRTTLAMASSDSTGRATRDVAQTGLAVILADQGRRQEAKTLAADICHAKRPPPVKRALDTAKLCD